MEHIYGALQNMSTALKAEILIANEDTLLENLQLEYTLVNYMK